MSAAVVFCGTHPKVSRDWGDPADRGVYYDPISFPSRDGTLLQAWLVPVVDAKRVLARKDKVLSERQPAIVLVHDFGRSPQQMLPLLAPLHEDGIVVVAVGLRGLGAGRASGRTFGLNESLDVAAAVDMLRRRPFVDPDRIAVLGIGTGANAALLAAAKDAKIKALILADPVAGPEEAVARYVGPSSGARGGCRS